MPLFITHLLIAVWNTYKTGPLVNEEAGESKSKGEQDKEDDDQIEWMCKQAASGSQGTDDRPVGNDPSCYW